MYIVSSIDDPSVELVGWYFIILFFITQGGDAVNLPVYDPLDDSWWVSLMLWGVSVEIEFFFKQGGCNRILFHRNC